VAIVISLGGVAACKCALELSIYIVITFLSFFASPAGCINYVFFFFSHTLYKVACKYFSLYSVKLYI